MRNNLIVTVMVTFIALSVKTEAEDAYLLTSLASSIQIPVSNEQWKTFATAGISLVMPSSVKQFDLEAAIEAGKLESTDHTVRLECMQIRCGLRMRSLVGWKGLDVNPSCGISSMMVGNAGKGLGDIMQLHVFSNVENEFGVYAALTSTYSFKTVTISVPLVFNRILSSPERFAMVSGALQIGYTFK